MHKIIVCLFFILFFAGSTSPCFAENWIDVSTAKTAIYIDKDSITEKNGYKFYNIKLFSKPHKNFIFATVQATPKTFALIRTCKYEYRNNPEICPQNYDPVSSDKLKPIIQKSKIYNANNYAYAGNLSAPQPKTPPKVSDQKLSEGRINAQYMKHTQEKIKSNWHPGSYLKSHKCIVSYKISSDGELISSEILQSSGEEKFDKTALEAVRLSAPFQPLPKHLKVNSIEIHFTFAYKVYFGSKK